MICFFKQKTAYDMRISDWSSDVCSSDLSLVIIFTDMLESYRKEDELFAALQHLRHNRHEVVLFHVHDALHEMDFNYENRPYLFVDMESGQEIKAFPHEIGRASCRERVCQYV